MLNVKEILNNIKNIYSTDNVLETLMDFERVLDELDTFVFKNWSKGELVEGPVYEKYFVTCTFMWPKQMMPDPRGAERLLDYKCKVEYIKSYLEYPVAVKDQDDFQDGTHMPKMTKKPVWLVKIVMPKTLMHEIERGSISLESDTIDLEDLQQSYETGLDNDVLDQGQQSPQDQQQAAQGMPMPQQGQPNAQLPPV